MPIKFGLNTHLWKLGLKFKMSFSCFYKSELGLGLCSGWVKNQKLAQKKFFRGNRICLKGNATWIFIWLSWQRRSNRNQRSQIRNVFIDTHSLTHAHAPMHTHTLTHTHTNAHTPWANGSCVNVEIPFIDPPVKNEKMRHPFVKTFKIFLSSNNMLS